jgi:hypothetical protein
VSAQLKRMALRQCDTRLIDACSYRPWVSGARNLRGETKIIIEIAKTAAARRLRRSWSERAVSVSGVVSEKSGYQDGGSVFGIHTRRKNNFHDHAGSISGKICDMA